MKLLSQALAIGGAGFIGALARWGLGLMFGRYLPMRFPLATFVINITGSFFLGWFLTFITVRMPVSDTVRLAIGTGFVGAYTTFSTFMFDSATLMEEGAAIQAGINVIGSVVAGLIAVKLGMVMARRI